ncbi:MAG: AAA family ATPase [Anaerolineales bacterium]
MSAAAALHPPPLADWLVGEFISRPGLVLVVGEPGAKKTYAILDMAVCLAMGEAWLERPTSRGGVVWIDEESGAARFLKRLGQVMRAHEAPAGLPFHLSSLSGFDLRDADDIRTLSDKAGERDASLIVIDPLVGAIPGTDENSVFHLAPILRSLRALADRVSAAVVLIHHTNKAGIYRGSSHLRGAVDLMVQVRGKAHTPLIEFETLKTRDIPPQHFAAEIHFEPPEEHTMRVWLTPADLAQARLAVHSERPLSAAAQHVLDYLGEQGPSPTAKITSSAQSCTPEQARSAIYQLKKMGIIERVDDGGVGMAATYGLIE